MTHHAPLAARTCALTACAVLSLLATRSALAVETLYGITDRDMEGFATLVSIDPATGAATLLFPIALPGDLVPESMTFHRSSGQLVVVVSPPTYQPPFSLLRIDPTTGASSIVPVTGFPSGQAKLHGIEYRETSDDLVVTFGATGTNVEDRVARISLDGQALAFSPNLGTGDNDYLAWPDAEGRLILSDPNANDSFPRLLSLVDPFGTPSTVLYADTPFQNSLGDPAVRPSDLTLFTVRYDAANGTLLRLDGTAYVPIGTFGAGEQVVGIAFANIQCAADLSGDGVVDGTDIGLLLGAWGSGSIDLDGNGTTDATDLAVLLGEWGPCPAGPGR